jgi:NitT/TauT family transport system permease protein
MRRWAAVAAGAVAILVGWAAIVAVFDYPPFILPGPLVVAERFVAAFTDGTFWPHLATTLVEVLLGLAVGGAVGVAIGYVLARSRLAGAVLSPYIVAAQSTPILALAPLIALWFGTGLGARVVICALIVFFPIAVSTMVGFRSVDRGLLEMGRSLRATAGQLLRTIEVPAALPQILGGFRIGVTLAVVGAIVAEWAGGERGLGVLINLARGSLFDIPLLFATLLLIAIVGVAMYAVVVAVEHRILGARR